MLRTRSGLPATSSSTLGTRALRGWMRRPLPAAAITPMRGAVTGCPDMREAFGLTARAPDGWRVPSLGTCGRSCAASSLRSPPCVRSELTPPPRLVNGTARAADGAAPVLCRGTRVLANRSPRMPASRTARSTVLAPLLHNFFWNDDFVHLYDIATRSLWSFSSELFLGQFYLVRNLVFAGLFP